MGPSFRWDDDIAQASPTDFPHLERATVPTTTAPLAVHTLYGETMGTRWRVDLCAARGIALDALHAGIQARLDAIVAQMSTWEPASDLSRFNRAEAGHWQALPDDVLAVLACAFDIAQASDGAFDPTVAPLVAAWGFGAGAAPRGVPDDTVLAGARARVGWTRLGFDAEASRLQQPGDAALDLSAIAKGYGVDAVVDWLRGHGIDAALVDIGSELRGFGRKPDGTLWRVLVETGDGDDDEPCVLALDDAAVATSGTHWQRFEADGREYTHTIDPRSGRPVEDAPVAVSVVAREAMRADAWATALTVMGSTHGFSFARREGLAARFVVNGTDGLQHVLATPAFDAWVAT